MQATSPRHPPHRIRRPTCSITRALTALAAGFALTGCDLAASSEVGIDELPVLEAQEQQRIGSIDDPDYGFSRIGLVDVDRDGNVYVLELQDAQIRVYARDGRLLRRIGRRGGGPGEFQNPPRFGVVGDTVWTYDMAAGRITLFDRAGTVLSTGPTHGVQIDVPSGFGYIVPHSMRADGLFTSSMSRIAYRQDAPPTVQPGDSIPVPLVLFDAGGNVVDTLGWDPSPPPRMVPPPGSESAYPQPVTVAGRRYSVPSPPTTLPSWIPLHDGRIVVDVPYATGGGDDAFTVTRLALDGDTVWHRRLTYEPVPFDEASLDSAAARSARGAQFISGGPPPPPADQLAVITRQIREAMKFPPYRLPITYPWPGPDGSIWLLRDDGESETSRWIVLNADGRTRGQLVLPRRVRPLWSRGDSLWAAVPDELDVPWLVRYRIGG